MSKKILDFANFKSYILVKESTEIADPANSRFNALLSQVRDFSTGVSSSSGASSTSTPAPATTSPDLDLDSIGQVKAIDLFLATKSGEGLSNAMSQNPDLINQIVGGETASDSPDDPDKIWDAIQRSLKNKEAFSRNEKAIKEFTGNEKSVLKPESDLLPQSSPYDYKSRTKGWGGDSKDYDTENKKWNKLKDFLESEGVDVNYTKANLIAVRNYFSEKRGHQNHYTDWVILMSPENKKEVKFYHATTTPSPFYLPIPFRNWYSAAGSKNSINPKGLAILQPGVYSYKIGVHKGKHRALIQNGQVSVERYQPILNPNSASFSTFSPGNSERGNFGINIHSAYGNSDPNSEIGAYSAGCVVIQKQKDLDNLLSNLGDYGQSQIGVVLVELDELKRKPKKILEEIIASGY
jgi:hypothetical protein